MNFGDTQIFSVLQEVWVELGGPFPSKSNSRKQGAKSRTVRDTGGETPRGWCLESLGS